MATYKKCIFEAMFSIFPLKNIALLEVHSFEIRRPRPLPRQGRRLGPPEVWNFAFGSQARDPPNASAGLQGNNSYSYMSLPSIFQGVQDRCLRALKPPKRFQRSRRPPRQQLLQLHVPAICLSGRSRLPFARPQTVQTLPKASKATSLTATSCPCHLFFRGFNMSLPSVFQDVQDCRLPGLKPSKRFRRPSRQQLLQLLHAPAICFSGGSRLPFVALKPPNPSNASAGLQGNNSYSYFMPLPSLFQGVQDCRCPPPRPHIDGFLWASKPAVCQPLNPPNPPNA